MKQTGNPKEASAERIDRKNGRKVPAGTLILWQGRRIRLVQSRGVWRVRCRTRGFHVDFSTGTGDLPAARELALRRLESGEFAATPRGTASLADVVRVYLDSPLRCSRETARRNTLRLAQVVQQATGKELASVPAHEAGPRLWDAYAAARQGGRLDLNTRLPVNRGINAALRSARSLFLRALRPTYQRSGIILAADAGEGLTLPEPWQPLKDLDDDAMLAAWEALPRGSPLWLAIGLARFAGLRREELECVRGGWIDEHRGATRILLRDRPEESWWTKTGKPYAAPVYHAGLAEWIRAVPADSWIIEVPNASRAKWFAHQPQAWLRQFTAARLPLHRLRARYAEHVRELTESAILAKAAGIEAARSALGHTTAATTQAHYLTTDALR